MANDVSGSENTASVDRSTQLEFFSPYHWCLNPILTVNELWEKMQSELERFPALDAAWKREESKENLYLFACAISCTVDDFFGRRLYIKPLGERFPKLMPALDAAESIINLPASYRNRVSFRWAIRWRKELDRFVESVCMLLLAPDHGAKSALPAIKARLKEIRSYILPRSLGEGRMRLNEGYRCQDLNYHDVLKLADRFLERSPDMRGKVAVIGARTAGSYFAPLLKVYLEQKGIKNISWSTIRPKYGAHGQEKMKLKAMLRGASTVLLTDDYSNTGRTFKMLAEAVGRFGVPPERMVILAPIHPVREARSKSKGAADGFGWLTSSDKTDVITISHDDLYLNEMLEPDSVRDVLSSFLQEEEAEDLSVVPTEWSDDVNREISSRYSESFQVRLKRAFEVTVKDAGGNEEKRRIIAKSVGPGWLGYHAFFAADALREFVPRVLAVRGGLMFMEWVEGRTLFASDVSDDVLAKMAAYIARRAESLELNEDPRSSPPYLGWGWLELLAILRRVYNPVLGYLKHGTLLSRLKKALRYSPALVDGRMRPQEWLMSDRGLVKLDFEHHNFGAPELDVVDPAYDIAMTIFEFHLSEVDEEKLTFQYSLESGDTEDIGERIFIYKILYAAAEAGRLHHRITSDPGPADRRELNDRLQWTWDFRVFSMNRFCGELMKDRAAAGYYPRHEDEKKRLFFMDVDGVFNSEIFGFPHATLNALMALSVLRSGGLTVVLNTGRSCDHVRDYCLNYGLAGGIAEYGSAIVDFSGGTDIPLVDEEVIEELSKCRYILSSADDVFVDPGYRYAVRAFRYTPAGTRGLSPDEAEGILKKHGLHRLRVISRGADSYFLGKEADKGAAIEKYLMRFPEYAGSFGAIGDSDEDVPMLLRAGDAFAPSNCSSGIRNLENERKCRVMPGRAQTGLLQAAEAVTRTERQEVSAGCLNSYEPDTLQALMMELLTLADYPPHRRVLALLKRGKLI